jgi:adenosylcobinamide-phosphate synthase
LSAAALLAGYTADITLGDPRVFHPVAGFGRAASALESRIYAPTRRRGALATVLMVGGAAALGEYAARSTNRCLVTAGLTWAALGGRSLRREAGRVETLLASGDLDGARCRLRGLCGRDAADLDGDAIRAAAIESLAENTSDAVVGALFWAALLGPAGAAGYRAANTLDAMWGHHFARYEHFGWAAARLDDLLNWVPARLTAALAGGAAPLVGGTPAAALAAVRHDAGGHPSPNAGVVEAAFAGALGVRLGGPLAYGGQTEQRPYLSHGPAPGMGDLHRAQRLNWAVCTGAVLLLSGYLSFAPSLTGRVSRERR